MEPSSLPDPHQSDKSEKEIHHVSDRAMPNGFHHIKCTLLTEISCAATFSLCMQAADALSNARRIGESISREINRTTGTSAKGSG